MIWQTENAKFRRSVVWKFAAILKRFRDALGFRYTNETTPQCQMWKRFNCIYIGLLDAATDLDWSDFSKKVTENVDTWFQHTSKQDTLDELSILTGKSPTEVVTAFNNMVEALKVCLGTVNIEPPSFIRTDATMVDVITNAIMQSLYTDWD